MNVLISFLRQNPLLAWTIAITVTVILVTIISISILTGKNIGYQRTEKGMAFGFFYPVDEPIKTENYYGYFKDWGTKKEEYITHENLTITYHSKNIIKASATGNVVNNSGDMITKEWQFLGFKSDSRIVLSYITSKSEPANQVTGIGVYFLEEKLGVYKGKWRGLDSGHQAIIECPYVLANKLISDEEAKKEFEFLQQPCIDVTEK